MKKIAALTLSLFLTYGTAFADTPKDTPKDADAQPAKPATPAKAKAAKKADKSDSAIAAEIEELRQTLQAQQEQLTLLKEELAKRDRQIDEARDAAAAANARAAEASTKATEAVNTTAEVKSNEATLNTTVANLKSSNEVLRTTVATAQADEKKSSEDGPATIRYKGVSITPGGFFAAETVFRNRATSADINTPFTAESSMAFAPTGQYLAVSGDGGIQMYSLQSGGTLTPIGSVVDPGVPFNVLKWDNGNHLYAISGAALYVFSSNAGVLTQAPGSPIPVTEAGSLAVLPEE